MRIQLHSATLKPSNDLIIELEKFYILKLLDDEALTLTIELRILGEGEKRMVTMTRDEPRESWTLYPRAGNDKFYLIC